MPKAASDEEIQLRGRARRRLLGAIVLVTIAVVVLPMVLDQEPRQVSQDIAIHIPSRDETSPLPPVAKPARTEIAKPISGKPAAESAPPAKSGGEGPAKPPAASPEKPAEAPPAAAKASEPGTAREPAESAGTREAFVVQVDAFSDPSNAQQRQLQLASQGVESFTDVVKTQKGALTRVRVGPFPSRDAAEKERERLAKLGIQGVVAPK